MARLYFQRVPTTVAFAGSGTISLELSPVPATVCGLIVIVRTSITTTTVTAFNDYWDRIISRLNLVGQVGSENKTFFDFSNMRLPYHWSRRMLGRFAPRRPTITADSQSSAVLKQIAYVIHFGTNPVKPNGEPNWMDLTAGIPPTQKGQLTLGGTWGAAAAPGTNVTVGTDSLLEVYLYGVRDEAGDNSMVQAYPVFSMTTPTPTATSTTWGTTYNVTAGNFLKMLAIMQTNGTNAPRDNQVLNSLRLYHQLENRPIIEFGGRAGSSDSGGGDYQIAELFSQLGIIVPSDNNATLGVPAWTDSYDEGLVFLHLSEYSNRVHQLYGADLRKVATGDVRLDWGVADATGIALDVLYQRYELNRAHPANAAWN